MTASEAGAACDKNCAGDSIGGGAKNSAAGIAGGSQAEAVHDDHWSRQIEAVQSEAVHWSRQIELAADASEAGRAFGRAFGAGAGSCSTRQGYIGPDVLASTSHCDKCHCIAPTLSPEAPGDDAPGHHIC